jgi:hypothetical protein
MTPKFAKPKFDYSEMIKQYDEMEVGGFLKVRECEPDSKHNSEQASLCNLLRAKDVKPGKDAQTTVFEGVLFIRKLTAKKLG